MKKLIIICLFISFNMVTFAETDSFIDIESTDWFYDNVMDLKSNGIISGYEDSTFRPQQNISVEEFVTLTIKVMGETEADIVKKRWSDGFIEKAKSLQLIQLNEFTSYNRMITRGEMARIILRASDIPLPDNFMSFGEMIADFDTMDNYWQNIAIRVYSTGIISGYPDGRFDLEGLATRAEASAILIKIYDPTKIKAPVFVPSQFQIRKAEIQVLWDQLKPLHDGDYFITEPDSESPYVTGTLETSYLDDAINMLNFIRQLAHLSGNTYYSDSANLKAQHGVVLNAASTFSHTPEKPEDMTSEFYDIGYEATSSGNLAVGIHPLSNAIKRLVDDEDVDNIERIGHRRWFLLPTLYEVGLGYLEKETDWRFYSVIKVFRDLERQSLTTNRTLWPSQTAFPLQFFNVEIPWSISLNPSIYDASKVSNIEVKLENLTTEKRYYFDASDKTLDGEFFNVETSGYGVPFCIIFRPDFNSEDNYQAGDLLKVTVSNVYLLDGTQTTIEYETRFFNLN